ncbi:MAG: hypothetical protein AMXMBFR13_06610 [Phycisphaerae bacterium]
MSTLSRFVLLSSGLVLATRLGSPASAEVTNATEMASQLARSHAYLFTEQEQQRLDRINKQLREAREEERKARDDQDAKNAAIQKREAASKRLLELLEKNEHLVTVKLSDQTLSPPTGGTVELPGEAGAMLLRVESGEGETRFVTISVDYSQIQWERSLVEVPVGGITWAIVGLTNVPAKRIHSSIRFKLDGDKMLHWPVDLVTPEKARLRVKFLEENGQPTPAMLRLTWKTGGLVDVRPTTFVDIGPQFDAQGAPVSRRATNIPGKMGGDVWCVSEPLDMMISPGDYHIAVRRGIEHVPISEHFSVKPGEVLEKTYTIKRWVDMRDHGWYSGDDHVHNRILSDADAERLMAWVKAEDIHLANIVKMGDIYRTWFEQRGFGKEFRVIDGDYILSPGQECPRTHAQIGHTISMNITSMVRDTDKYYAYDWVAKTVHDQGGLFGYAHVCSQMFHVHRDMSMNIPAGNVDFVELLQFAYLGTDLYYDFLNTGFKVTASAGSDVPWGGTVGEARLYARVDKEDFSADTWFEALRRGRTFVTDGPMIEFTIDEAVPGDEIKVTSNKKLKLKARAWGDPGRALPIKLEIVQHGEVIREAKSQGDSNEAAVEFEIEAGNGSWVAARAEGGEGTRAHTTPIYIIREGLRFWRYDKVEELIAKRMESLQQVENIIKEAREAVAKGGVHTKEAGEDRAVRQLAIQGDDLMRRVEAARKLFAELRETANKEASKRQ